LDVFNQSISGKKSTHVEASDIKRTGIFQFLIHV